MAKKLSKMNDDRQSEPPLSSAVKDSAQQIWLAGLGAFSKAQEQGSKAFETLVQEGLSLQRKTQLATQESIAEASSLMNSMASDIQAQASHRLDKLETIFEDRVARALSRLGIPSSTQMNVLLARLDQLEKSIQRMNAASTATVNKAVDPVSSAKAEPRRQAAAKKIVKPAAGQKLSSTTAAKSTAATQLQAQSPAAGKRRKVSKSD